jgi:1,4-alpha-glucan branching enzyme
MAKRTETFRLNAPTAQKVTLVGDFTDWQERPILMKKGSDGNWTTTVKLPQGEYNYRFMVDGTWCDDPECAHRVPNPFGGFNMVRRVAWHIW